MVGTEARTSAEMRTGRQPGGARLYLAVLCCCCCCCLCFVPGVHALCARVENGGSSAALSCPSGSVISSGMAAQYFWDSSVDCAMGPDDSDSCYQSISLSDRLACAGLETCQIDADFSRSKSGCSGSPSSLVVQYSCAPKTTAPPAYDITLWSSVPCAQILGNATEVLDAAHTMLTSSSVPRRDILSIELWADESTGVCGFYVALCCEDTEELVTFLAKDQLLVLKYGDSNLPMTLGASSTTPAPSSDDNDSFITSPFFYVVVAGAVVLTLMAIFVTRHFRRARHPTLRVVGDRVVVQEAKRGKPKDDMGDIAMAYRSDASREPRRTAGGGLAAPPQGARGNSGSTSGSSPRAVRNKVAPAGLPQSRPAAAAAGEGTGSAAEGLPAATTIQVTDADAEQVLARAEQSV